MGGGASKNGPTTSSSEVKMISPVPGAGMQQGHVGQDPISIKIGEIEGQGLAGAVIHTEVQPMEQKPPSPNPQAFNPHTMSNDTQAVAQNPSESSHGTRAPAPDLAHIKATNSAAGFKASFKQGMNRAMTWRGTFKNTYKFVPRARGMPCTIEEAEKKVGLVQFETERGYWHCGISLGNGQIAHFAANSTGELATEGPGSVIMHRLKLVVGNYTALEFVPRTNAEWDPIKVDEAVFDRALDIFIRGFGRYHHINNNCEDFALNCIYLNPPRKPQPTTHEEPMSLAEQGMAFFRKKVHGGPEEMPRDITTPDLLDSLKLTDVFTKGGNYANRKTRFQRKKLSKDGADQSNGMVKSRSMEFFFGGGSPTSRSPLPRIPSHPMSTEDLSERGLKSMGETEDDDHDMNRSNTVEVLDISGRSEFLTSLKKASDERRNSLGERKKSLPKFVVTSTSSSRRGSVNEDTQSTEESGIAGLPAGVMVKKDSLRVSRQGSGKAAWTE